MWNSAFRRQAGVTLVELIVALVIVGAALAGLVAVLARSNTASADPLLLQQKVAIAESLMGEILLKPYAVDATPITAGVRETYNDVQDFNGYGLANGQVVYGIRDVDNNAIPGLETYGVAVDVTAVALTNVPNGDALKITITVTHQGDAAGDAFVLTGWRTKP